MTKAIILPPQPAGSEKVHVNEDTSRKANSVEITQTAVSTTAIRIAVPELAKNFVVKHTDPSAVVWIGLNDSITAAGSTVWPMKADELVDFVQFVTGNENQLYAIVSSGTVTLYCMGSYFDA